MLTMGFLPGKGAGRTQTPGEFCTFGYIHVAIMNFRAFVVVVVQKRFPSLLTIGAQWRTHYTSLMYVIHLPFQINKPYWEGFLQDYDI